MAVALPQSMPAIYMGNQYDLTRLQDNTKSTVDLLLRAVSALQSASTTTTTPARCVALNVYDSINGTTANRPATLPSAAGGSAPIVVMPFAGSVVGLCISTNGLSGGEGPTSTGTLTLSAYKNNAASGAAVTLPTAAAQITTTWTAGTYPFAAGDYFQFWASSSGLTTSNVASYNYQLWVQTT